MKNDLLEISKIFQENFIEKYKECLKNKFDIDIDNFIQSEDEKYTVIANNETLEGKCFGTFKTNENFKMAHLEQAALVLASETIEILKNYPGKKIKFLQLPEMVPYLWGYICDKSKRIIIRAVYTSLVTFPAYEIYADFKVVITSPLEERK